MFFPISRRAQRIQTLPAGEFIAHPNVGNHRTIGYGTKVSFAQSVWEAVHTSFVGQVGGTSERFAQEFPLQVFKLALKFKTSPSPRLRTPKS
jgi:hypothetical protein